MKNKIFKLVNVGLAMSLTMNSLVSLANTSVASPTPVSAAAAALMVPEATANSQFSNILTTTNLNNSTAPAVPKLTAEQQEEINKFGETIEREVEQFIAEYNGANPPYVLDDKAIAALLSFSAGDLPPKESDVQGAVLKNSKRFDPSAGIDGALDSAAKLEFRHKATILAESVAKSSFFGNSTAPIEMMMSYLFYRFLGEPENSRALLALLMGFRDLRFDESWATKFRLDHSYWYNVSTWGLSTAILANFLLQFVGPKVARFKNSSKLIAKMLERLDRKSELAAIENLPSDMVLNKDGFLVKSKPQLYRHGKAVSNSVEWFAGPIGTTGKIVNQMSSIGQSVKDAARDALIGKYFSLRRSQRLLFVLKRIGAYSLAAAMIGGTRDGLEHLQVGLWNEVGVAPEDEFNEVLVAPMALHLACETDIFVTELNARNYNLLPSTQYRSDVEKINELVEEFALVRLPLQGYDRMDLSKFMQSVTANKILSGSVSLQVVDNALGTVQFIRQYNNDRIDKTWSCPRLAGREANAPIDISLVDIDNQIRLASQQVQGAHVLQNVQNAISRLVTVMNNNDKTKAGARALTNFDFASGDVTQLPASVQVVFRHYVIELLDMNNDDLFNEDVMALATRANAKDGTAAFLRYLQNAMQDNAMSFDASAPPAEATATLEPIPSATPLKKLPSEILGVKVMKN